MGTLSIKERMQNNREGVRMSVPVASFNDATGVLHAWLWQFQTQKMACTVIMAWMRGERYADHSVNVRYYVPGTVGHWFDILYRA